MRFSRRKKSNTSALRVGQSLNQKCRFSRSSVDADVKTRRHSVPIFRGTLPVCLPAFHGEVLVNGRLQIVDPGYVGACECTVCPEDVACSNLRTAASVVE